MSKCIFLLLFSFYVLPAYSDSDELMSSLNQAAAPNEEDLLNTSALMTLVSMDTLVQTTKKDCPDIGPQSKKEVIKKTGEALCFCDLSQLTEAEKKSLPFLGKLEKVDYSLTTGNDNLFHGFGKYIPYLKNFNGDDRGRTFSMSNDLSLYGSKGEIKLGWSSTGFGRPVRINNSYYNSQDRQNLEFLEQDSLYLRGDKYIKRSEDSRYRLIGELRLDHFDDQGPGAYSIQKKWHEMMGDKAVLHYSYLDHRGPESSVTAMVGVGIDKVFDLDKWKCVVKAEALIGASNYQGGKALASAKMSTDVMLKSLPWLAVSAWTSIGKGLDGKEKHHGITLSLPFKVKSVSVTPFLGVERHETGNDLNYSRKDGKPYEAYHVLGLRISY